METSKLCDRQRTVCNISGGKDSLAQGLLILERGIPCDEFVFYDTGMEFEAIYRIFDKLLPVLSSKGIKLTVLHPENPFLYDMLRRPVERPMKRWECKKYGKYGDVFKMEYVFQLEEWQNEPAKPKEDG